MPPLDRLDSRRHDRLSRSVRCRCSPSCLSQPHTAPTGARTDPMICGSGWPGAASLHTRVLPLVTKMLCRSALPATIGRSLAPADLAAGVADPVQYQLSQDVAATDDADELAPANHRQPCPALLDDERPGGLDVCVLGDGHHVRGHHFA